MPRPRPEDVSGHLVLIAPDGILTHLMILRAVRHAARMTGGPLSSFQDSTRVSCVTVRLISEWVWCRARGDLDLNGSAVVSIEFVYTGTEAVHSTTAEGS